MKPTFYSFLKSLVFIAGILSLSYCGGKTPDEGNLAGTGTWKTQYTTWQSCVQTCATATAQCQNSIPSARATCISNNVQCISNCSVPADPTNSDVQCSASHNFWGCASGCNCESTTVSATLTSSWSTYSQCVAAAQTGLLNCFHAASQDDQINACGTAFNTSFTACANAPVNVATPSCTPKPQSFWCAGGCHIDTCEM